MRFPYQKILVKETSKPQVTFRPLIPITILSGEKKVTLYGLVDSGADVCLFPQDVCRALGIDLLSGEEHELSGIGKGSVTFYLHSVKIKVGSKIITSQVGFSKNASAIPFAILGQKGFFDNFIVAFHYKKKWIEIISH